MLAFDRPAVTLRELQTDYGIEDLYDLIEVGMVLSENSRLISQWQEQQDVQKGFE